MQMAVRVDSFDSIVVGRDHPAVSLEKHASTLEKHGTHGT
jgi:hypothetical protein